MEKIVLLYDASQAVISTFDLDEVLRHILSVLQKHFAVDRAAVLMLDKEAALLKIRSQSGLDNSSAALEIPADKGLVGEAVAQKQVVYVPRVQPNHRYAATLPDTRSELVLPLLIEQEVIGVLDCQSSVEDGFDSQSIELLKLFSAQAAIALHNARRYAHVRRRSAQLEAINAIARQTTSVLELDELLDRACTYTQEWFAVDHVCILLKEDEHLVLRAQKGRLTALLPVGVALPSGSGLASQVLESGQAVLVNDVNQTAGYVRAFRETLSELCIPLINFGETVGVLALESSQLNAFDSADLEPLHSVADICAIAIQNARLFERVKQMAYIDGLTALFNRRFFESKIEEEIERVKRYEGGLSLILIDIDHFKKINDEYGHVLGDEVLRQLSNILTQHLRKVDIACRYGGEEFIIIAPQTTGEQALRLAEKLRRVIAEWPFPGVSKAVTISAGVADYPRHGTTREELIQAADAALYNAKQSSRNCVRVARQQEQEADK